MKLSKPRTAAAGNVSPGEIVSYLYKLTSELETELSEITKRICSIDKAYDKAFAGSSDVPAYIKEQTEALSSDVADLSNKIRGLTEQFLNLQIWRIEFEDGYNLETTYLHNEIEALKKAINGG